MPFYFNYHIIFFNSTPINTVQYSKIHEFLTREIGKLCLFCTVGEKGTLSLTVACIKHLTQSTDAERAISTHKS